ncbi:MAG TPA: hypothetical protein PLH72_16755 [Vicinamibacterales bacterium]|nr:hypothetical protein [Vicinamibacterales bacterium]
MTIDQPVATRLEGRSLAWRLGASSTLAIGIVLLTWALTVDFTKVSYGFFSDGATYYSLAHSLADDFDFEYRREDLVRVWREFPSGPEGIFLKRGRDVDVSLGAGFPFVHVTSRQDPDEQRLYYGKSYIYPLAAAPFVFLFGTNGFLVLHAVLITLAFLCAYAFLVARSHPLAALVFAFAFMFLSVAPVYMVWMTPDFFNLAVVTFGYFFWCYKDVVGPNAVPLSAATRVRWFLGNRSDVIAAIFLGIATFSKPTHVLLIAPLLVSALLRGQWQRTLRIGVFFGLVVVLLFGANIAITGEWNYQGGDRRTFYSGMGGFPFQTEQNRFDAVGDDRTTNSIPVEVLTGRDAFVDVFRRNLGYFFFGRHTGFVPYYFPGVMAILLFVAATRDRAVWQWLTLAAGLGSAVALILYMPFTYSGGGGPIGNRYFLGVYPVFLFLTPPLQTAVPGLVAMAVSGLFTTQILSNPFYASFHPGEHTKTGLFRLLPPELTLVNDLPVNVSPSRSRQPLGGTPPVSAYFLDDNAYNREGDAFWVRGESRADLLLRAPIVTEAGAAGEEETRPLRIAKLEVYLETGPKANRVVVSSDAETRVIDLPASNQRSFTLAMPRGLPYRPDPRFPTNFVYNLSIDSETGFIPLFESGVRDNRFLGVYVRLVPVYE